MYMEAEKSPKTWQSWSELNVYIYIIGPRQEKINNVVVRHV